MRQEPAAERAQPESPGQGNLAGRIGQEGREDAREGHDQVEEDLLNEADHFYGVQVDLLDPERVRDHIDELGGDLNRVGQELLILHGSIQRLRGRLRRVPDAQAPLREAVTGCANAGAYLRAVGHMLQAARDNLGDP